MRFVYVRRVIGQRRLTGLKNGRLTYPPSVPFMSAVVPLFSISAAWGGHLSRAAWKTSLIGATVHGPYKNGAVL